ncbi:MAG: acyl transferase, partial [Bacteroidia bacterium]|nr:acyl transferase [Bacteroidia bacterium]
PNWMKFLVREIDDPLSVHTSNKQGLINIIDLANIYTCSFIATSDIGKLYDEGMIEVLGRSDFSDIRGCNLMYQ